MATASTREIKHLLRAWGAGDEAALDELTRLCYQELRRIALQHMRREQPGHTLQRVLHSVRQSGVPTLGHFLSWSPDGKFLAFSERVSPLAPFGIYLLSVDGLEKRKLTTPPAGTRGDRFRSFSPSGDAVAFTRRSNNDTDDVYFAPVNGGEPTRLTSDNSVINGLA